MLGTLLNVQGDGLREHLAGCAGDRKFVDGGFFRREINAARVRGPDGRDRRIKRDCFSVGHVVAELRRLTGMDCGRRDVEAADGEFAAAELLDGLEIFLMALLVLALFCFLQIMQIGFVARIEDVDDIQGHAKNHE